MSPCGEINLYQVFPEIIPGAVGPVARPGIDMFTDPITKQEFQITVDMVVTHKAEAADIGFQVDDDLRGEPEAEAGPQKRFKILVIVINNQRAVLDLLVLAHQRKFADIDGDGGNFDGTQIDSDVLVERVKSRAAQDFQG